MTLTKEFSSFNQAKESGLGLASHNKPNFDHPGMLAMHNVDVNGMSYDVNLRSLYHRSVMPDVLERLWNGNPFRAHKILDFMYLDGFSYKSLQVTYGDELYTMMVPRLVHEIETRLCLHDPVVLVRGYGFQGAVPNFKMNEVRAHSLVLDKHKLGAYCFDKLRAPRFASPSDLSAVEGSYPCCILVFERQKLYNQLRAEKFRSEARRLRADSLRGKR